VGGIILCFVQKKNFWQHELEYFFSLQNSTLWQKLWNRFFFFLHQNLNIFSLFPYFNLFVSIFIQSYVNIKLHVSTLLGNDHLTWTGGSKKYSDSKCCWKKYSDFGGGKKKICFKVFVIMWNSGEKKNILTREEKEIK
jgi:hypothetical protein